MNVLCDRIGKLDHTRGGSRLGRLPGYDSIQSVAAGQDANQDPVRLLRCGLYVELGQEAL